jgi:hypothetical protein
MSTEIKKLPTLAEIASGELTDKEKRDAFTVLMNQQPPAVWCKEHPTARGVKYIPIDKIEFMLSRIFGDWHVEIRQTQVIANSAVVTIRLYYLHPLTGVEMWQDGIGAAPIHTDKGAGAMDWNATKADSVMKAVPAAESYAIKDAAEKIGRVFGKDLNRKDLLTYDGLIDMSKFEGAKLTEK